MAQRNLVVFGGSKSRPGDEAWTLAEEVGRSAAGAGYAVATGGYGGIMEAASAGARSAGGEAIGVLCDTFGKTGNAHLTQRIMTKDLYERLRRLIELGDAYVAMPGSTGTLAELALVWELLNKRLLPLRPLYCLGEFWSPVLSMFGEELTHDPRFKSAGLPDRLTELVVVCKSPAAIFEDLARRRTK